MLMDASVAIVSIPAELRSSVNSHKDTEEPLLCQRQVRSTHNPHSTRTIPPKANFLKRALTQDLFICSQQEPLTHSQPKQKKQSDARANPRVVQCSRERDFKASLSATFLRRCLRHSALT
eukprot:3433755-Amphidinium_carterae.1